MGHIQGQGGRKVSYQREERGSGDSYRREEDNPEKRDEEMELI